MMPFFKIFMTSLKFQDFPSWMINVILNPMDFHGFPYAQEACFEITNSIDYFFDRIVFLVSGYLQVLNLSWAHLVMYR